MAKVYKADGSVLEVAPAEGQEFTLEEMQAFVGGYIELVPTTLMPEGVRMYVDEEGLLKRKPLNEWASRTANMPLVGDVFVLETGDKI